MKTTHKDRRDHKLHHLLKEFLKRDNGNEVFKEMGMNIQDFHSAIRLTSSVKGRRDNSRSAYRHEIQEDKRKMITKAENKELEI